MPWLLLTGESGSNRSQVWREEVTETRCGLDGRPIRLDLQVTDAAGRTGSDHIARHTYPCPVVD